MDTDDILKQVDIVDYIKQFCDLEEKNGEWWGLSPFKDEKTPSFSVNAEKQRFYDFSSGAYGNILDFIKKYNNCDFYKALKILKKYANISDDDYEPVVRLESTKVAKRFRKPEKNAKDSKTTILPYNYMERYEWDCDKLSAWKDEGIQTGVMRKFDVRYDSFSNRIVFPIKDMGGNIINVCGRTLEKDYKDKKIRKYTYFKPLGRLDTLYGFSDNRNSILNKKEIIIFEGAKSVMMAYGWGIKNTAAILTSHLNQYQLIYLIKLGVRVVFALDEDVDIREDININKLKKYVKIEWVKNYDNLLSSKMAPVDAGLETWNLLYERRISIN